MARLSVILVGAALAIVFLVPLGAPKVAAATVPVSLYQRNFQFHVGNQFAAERNIALNVGDRIELRVENKDSTVNHTFTSAHFPQDTTNVAQDLSDNFVSLNVTKAGTPGAVVFWNYTVVAGDKGVWEYHCKPHVGGGMLGFFYIGQPTLSI